MAESQSRASGLDSGFGKDFSLRPAHERKNAELPSTTEVEADGLASEIRLRRSKFAAEPAV